VATVLLTNRCFLSSPPHFYVHAYPHGQVEVVVSKNLVRAECVFRNGGYQLTREVDDERGRIGL